MWSSVEQAWPALAREHEGSYPWMYLDPVGLITVGIGLLLEHAGQPTEECFGLPWTIDEQSATRAQIAAGWQSVNAHSELIGQPRAFATISHLRLDDQTINAALVTKTREFWSVLRSQLPDLEQWPADAQLSLIDMAYQLGPRFLGPNWPNFTAAAHADDFATCALHCSVRQASATRNARRRRLFENAAQVVALGLDPSHLWDQTNPEEDMTLTDEQIQQIAEKLADIIEPQIEAAVAAQLARQKPPTAKAIAVEVLNSKTSDIVKVADARDTVRVVTALSDIHKAVTHH